MLNLSSVPVFILAGGLGTRFSEETALKPKPLIEIGEIPILVHIMRSYYAHGFNDFVICAGYKSWEVKEFFLNYEHRCNHLASDHRTDKKSAARPFGENVRQEKWRVRVIDTGIKAMTGARVARAFDEIVEDEPFDHFAVTYGDGVCDVDLKAEFAFHVEHGKVGTVLGVPPPARFGELGVTEQNDVEGFLEKPENRQGLINGGFFFFNKKFRSFLETNDPCILERSPLSALAESRQLKTFIHHGFWHPMDTLRDKNHLQQLWDEGKAPWSKQ